MIPAPLEPELSAKIPSVEKPEGILVTKKGIIRKSDNFGSGAPIAELELNLKLSGY